MLKNNLCSKSGDRSLGIFAIFIRNMKSGIFRTTPDLSTLYISVRHIGFVSRSTVTVRMLEMLTALVSGIT
ncbi:hypothetical protein [Paenibacillus sp. V4I5]|uniref:hypothetical protein n=1 Tax=Paenibacillus sp. V4I5 TaxID=3042306 RepID=UPI00278F29D8|nr:hypothetical protein [Paenibacillus sp. V4I5]MDQ0917453.1 hypothetical protein [Paenibacillus sp. V4I5]